MRASTPQDRRCVRPDQAQVDAALVVARRSRRWPPASSTRTRSSTGRTRTSSPPASSGRKPAGRTAAGVADAQPADLPDLADDHRPSGRGRRHRRGRGEHRLHVRPQRVLRDQGKRVLRARGRGDQFLDCLATNEKYPFSTPELRDEIRHSFWLLNRVAPPRRWRGCSRSTTYSRTTPSSWPPATGAPTTTPTRSQSESPGQGARGHRRGRGVDGKTITLLGRAAN